MAAPDYVPPSRADQARTSTPIPPGRRWTATRPGDLRHGQPAGRGMGRPGPDQGYALSLAARFEDQLQLGPGEHWRDAVAGAVAVALWRAASFGRAPVKQDLEWAFGLFGYLDEAPQDLVDFRRTLFRGSAHDYWEQRTIVELIPESTLRLTPAEVRSQLGQWRERIGASS